MYAEMVAARYDPQQQSSVGGHHPHGTLKSWQVWTPGPVPLGLAYILLVETNPFPNLSLFYRTMLFEYPSVLSRFCSFCNSRFLRVSHISNQSIQMKSTVIYT